MADGLSQLSDEELEAQIAKKKVNKVAATEKPKADVSDFSDDELDVMIQAKKDPSILDVIGELGSQAAQKSLEGVSYVGEKIDQYTGAPTRAAVGVLQEDFTKVPEAGKAFGKQFGADPKLAPTGEQLAKPVLEAAGVNPATALSDKIPGAFSPTGEEWMKLQKGGPLDFTAGGTAGLGVNMAADVTNFIPLSAAAKGAGKVIEKGTELGTKAALKTAGVVVPEAVKVAAKTTEEAFRNTARAMGRFVNNKVRPEYEEAVVTAMKHNIDPQILNSSVKYGKDSSIARLERGMAQRPGGDKYIQSYQKGVGEIQNAFDRRISNIAGGDAKAITQADAGNLLKEGYGKARKNFFDQIDFTYRSVGSQAPDMPLTKESINQLTNSFKPVVEEAMRRSKNAALSPGARAQAQQVIDVAKGIQAQALNGKYMDLVDGLQGLGEAFEVGARGASDIPPDIAAYRKMYKGIKDSLVSTVKTNFGDDIANGLVKNNEAMSSWFENSAKGIEDIIEKSDKSPEQVFRQIVESGDTNKLRSIKSALEKDPTGEGQKILGQLKGAYVESLKMLDDSGNFSFARMRNKFKNDEKTGRVLRELFSPEEIKDMEGLIKLGEDMGPMKLNPSGTQEFQLFSEPLKSIGQTMENEGVLNYLKRRAEMGDVPMEMSGPELLNKIRNRTTAQPKSPLGRSSADNYLKGAQVIAVDQYDERPDMVSVPEDMKPGITQSLLKSKMTNTEKALILRRLEKDGEISQLILDHLSGSAPVDEDARQVLKQ